MFILLTVIIITLIFLLYVLNRLTLGRCKSNRCLIGKTAIITGGNGGIGFHVALGLAARGCRVIIADVIDGNETVKKIIERTGNTNVLYKYIDLSSFESIRKFAEDINKSESHLHILINNAGGGLFKNVKTNDGCNLGMQVNHFGGFLLTHLLIGLLKKSAPSRILFTSSLLSFCNELTETNINQPHQRYIYGNSKLCNIITAQGLAERLKGTGVTTYAIHPGVVNTNIFCKINNVNDGRFILNVINYMKNLTFPIIGKRPEEGAQTILHCALSTKLENESGQFYCDCLPFWRPTAAKNRALCEKVWKVSEELVQLKESEKF